MSVLRSFSVNPLGRRPAMRLAALVGVVFAVAGCGPSNIANEDSLTSTIIFGGRKLPPPPDVKRAVTCPYVTVLDGTVFYRPGGETARGVNYQTTLTNVARECSDDGVTLSITVGVQGRTILGEGGRAGSYNAPVRIAVRRGDQTLYSKLHPVPVQIPANDTHGVFSIVDDQIRVPIGTQDPGDEYKILVGLDPQGQRPARNRRR